MGPVLQKKVMGIFHYALKPTGFLMLGKSESASGFADLFTVIDREHKICVEKARRTWCRFSICPLPSVTRKPLERPRRKRKRRRGSTCRRKRTGSSSASTLRLALSSMRICTFSNSAGKRALTFPLRRARPAWACSAWCARNSPLELRTAIHRAKKQEIAVHKEGIRIQRDGRLWDVCLEVVPIKGDLGERFFLVLFQEPPVREPPGPETAGTGPASARRQELERLQRELQAAKEYLQSIIQEQEATNEELKSANEEALSSNEELQSTNEELETAKEELQSTNEELVTVNEQLQNRNF